MIKSLLQRVWTKVSSMLGGQVALTTPREYGDILFQDILYKGICIFRNIHDISSQVYKY